jgi:hypothetical protein
VSEPVVVRLVVVRLHLLRMRRRIRTSGGYPLVATPNPNPNPSPLGLTTGRAAELE